MSWSFGEIRALAIKAARGAGMPWGLAEEAGFAAIWLEERGIPGVEALAVYLEEISDYSTGSCPIASGAAISDSGEWQNAFPKQLFQPLLVVPFLANVLASNSVALKWNGHSLIVNAAGISGDFAKDAISKGLQDCTLQEGMISSLSIYRLPRIQPDRAPFVMILEKLAHKTYAPSTEESRAKGAGAGLNDND
ncbi:MAG: DUF3726 domain-containing protein [Pseudomonadota bacterium]